MAWASFISEAMASLVKGETSTLIMTDIPLGASAALEETCVQAKLTSQRLVAALYRSAEQGKLHVLRITGKGPDGKQIVEDESRVLVTTGVSDDAWAAWKLFADTLEVPVEEFFAHLLWASAYGEIRVTKPGDRMPNLNKGNMPDASSPYTAEQIRRGVEKFQADSEARKAAARSAARATSSDSRPNN